MNNENICSICGETLTKFGNKKLSDGIVCRNCVKKASSWLNDDDYAKRTIEDFRKHLEYRTENMKKLEDFKEERKVEGKYSLYLDEDNREFVISKRKDFRKDNADVLSYEQIQELSIFEQPYPETEDSVDLCMDIKLNNPEIDNIYFRVNEFPGLIKDSAEYKETLDQAFRYYDAFDNEKGIDFEQTEGKKHE